MTDYILIVEDSEVQREQLKRNLMSEGFTVKSAENGQDALLQIQKELPSLIISDILMPVMDGYEFCKKIKSDKNYYTIPIILLTSLSDPKDIIRGIQCGADCFLTKPCPPQLLFSHIQRIKYNLHYRKSLNQELITHYWYQGKPFDLNISQEQLMTLLLSTYENAVYKNAQLEKTREQLLFKDSELKNSNKELEKWLNDKKRFMAIAAHDILNPISAIIGYIELLLESEITNFSTDVKKILECIRNSSQYMLNLVSELLDRSKIAKGSFDLTVFKVDPVDLIEDTILLYKIIAFEKNISIDFKPSYLKTYLYLDGDRFKQAFSNLLSNSLKYSPSKGIIWIECHPEKDRFIITIKDQSVGIDGIKKIQLMEPLENISIGNTQEDDLGLGFAIAHKIIEAHKGTLIIETIDDNIGTLTTISLPSIKT